jgi:hypothetical protein
MTTDSTQFRLYASTRQGTPDLVCREEMCILTEPIVPKLMDTVPGLERGLRSGVCAPVLIGEAVVRVFAVFARRPHAYTAQDLAISLLVLGVAIVARYVRHLVGAWRWMYVVAAVVALYLNVFVLIVQPFLKVPALNAIAPTQSEPPFVVAQLALLAVFIALGVVTVRRFHEALVRTA